MDVSLWVAQIFLAAGFAASGLAKLTMTRDRLLETGQTGIAMFPMPVVRFTAAMEVLAANAVLFALAAFVLVGRLLG